MITTWQVLQRPALPGADPDIVLVKDGICWPALFFPVLWGLYRMQGTALAAYLAVLAAIVGLARLSGLDNGTEALLTLLLNVCASLFANDWRTWRLEAAGYRVVGVVGARSLAEAERRWFTEFGGETLAPVRAGAGAKGPWLSLLGEGAP